MNLKEINILNIDCINCDNKNNKKYGECYICFEKDAPLSECKCKNIYLHKECQKKYIEKKNSIVCSICKKNYNNAELIVGGISEKLVCCFVKIKYYEKSKYSDENILYRIEINKNIIYIR